MCTTSVSLFAIFAATMVPVMLVVLASPAPAEEKVLSNQDW
jgi:hypothetical protein